MGDVCNKMARVEESPNEVSILHNSVCDMMDNLERQAKALEELASGNLDIEYKAVSDKDVVGNAIEKLIRDDNTAFGTIMNATNQISIGSGQIAAASQTLAQVSTEQASAIQQIAASITDIANKTKDNANQANEVNNIVVQAKDDVVAGNQRMNEMVEAMREINDASENIQKIIKVIDDIAFNTNILALNATVEAARAGEQGKGFAVVAEEIRKLADNCRVTASNIQDINSRVIKSVQSLVVQSESILDFVEYTIITDYDAFVQIGEQYADDAESIRADMLDFYNRTKTMTALIEETADSFKSIDVAIHESAIGITTTAESTTQLVEGINAVSREMEDCKTVSGQISEAVSPFILDMKN